jgi:ribosomal-protein-alanine N-acetyltransferase
MKLTAGRLFLRDFVLADRDVVHEYASCFDVVQHQTWGPNNLLQTTEFVEASANEPSLEERRIFTLAVVLNDGTLIGGVLAALSTDGLEAEIGYSFNPRYWGMGYGTEAAKRLVEYLTSVHNIRRVFATCRPENAGSVNVLRKIGMRQKRLLARDVLIRGEWRDSLTFELLLPGRQAYRSPAQ